MEGIQLSYVLKCCVNFFSVSLGRESIRYWSSHIAGKLRYERTRAKARERSRTVHFIHFEHK